MTGRISGVRISRHPRATAGSDSLTIGGYIQAAVSGKAADPMIHSLTISGYRGFSHFEMGGLGRINLLVGRNNGGKTSVLEMLNLLGSGGDPSAILRIVSRRGERVYFEQQTRQPDTEFEINHLFHGHDLRIGATFSVSAKNQTPARAVRCAIGDAKPDPQLISEADGGTPASILLEFSGTPRPPVSAIPLTRRGGLRGDALDPIRRGQRSVGPEPSPVQFISTESLTFDALALMWNQIALTQAQGRVVKALKFIERKIEAIAPLIAPGPYYYGGGRGGFIVKLDGVDLPIPIGSLGDGTWRLLALSIALSRAKDGLLLIDEIDTGLHHSVMADMWRLIDETAKELNIQVFASTHSYDCVHSLATICDSNGGSVGDVTIQRIDTGLKKSVPYDEKEIRMAAEYHIEMR